MWSTKLSNGTRLIVKQDKYTKTAAIFFWAKIGSIYEPVEIRGVSHFLEHMFFKGTDKYPAGENTRVLNSVGGDANAFTSFEFTGYMAVVPARHLDLAADVIVDMLRNVPIRDKDFEMEKKVVIEEMHMRADEAARYTWDMLRETHFTRHPYREEIKGTEETITNMKPESMREFRERFYQPGNFIVTVAGAVEPEAVRDMLEKKLGDWRGREVHLPELPLEPPITHRRSRFLRGDVSGAHMVLGYSIPEFGNKEQIAVSTLSRILGGGRNSRLFKALVEKGLATVAEASISIEGAFPGLFDIRLVFDPEKLKDPLEIVEREIDRIASGDITEHEMELIRNTAEAEFLSSEESMLDTAITMGQFALFDQLDKYESLLDDIRALTAEDITAAARKYLSGGAGSMVVYGRDSEWLTDLEDKYGGKVPLGKPSAGSGETVFSPLPGGAGLILQQRPIRPHFAVSIAIKGGFRDEPAELTGLTAMLFNMLLRSRDPKGSGSTRITERLESLGASVSPFISNDLCGVNLSGLSKKYLPTIEAFRDLLLNPKWEEEDLLRQKDVVKQAIARKKDDLPSRTMSIFMKAYFGDHPYGKEISGEEENIDRMKLEHLHEWHGNLIKTENIIISGVGDLPDDARETLSILLPAASDDSASSGNGTKDGFQVFTPSRTPVSVSEIRDKHQVHIVLGTNAPPRKDKSRIPFLVMNNILSGMGNILWNELREKKGLCYVVTSGYSNNLLAGVFTVYMGTTPGRMEEAIEGIKKVITEFPDSPLDDATLDRAKQLIVGRYERSLERNINRAYMYAVNEALGEGYRFVDDFVNLVSAVTRPEVSRLAEKYLSAPVWTEAVIHPRITQ